MIRALRTLFLTPIAGVLLLACSAPIAGQSSAQRTTMDGVYTGEQSQRGETSFRQNCASCHSLSEFSGTAFQRRWNGSSVGSFFELVSSTMPQDFPGGLTPQQYADVLAYFFSQNGAPAGGIELPVDVAALSAIRIASPPPER